MKIVKKKRIKRMRTNAHKKIENLKSMTHSDSKLTRLPIVFGRGPVMRGLLEISLGRRMKGITKEEKAVEE